MSRLRGSCLTSEFWPRYREFSGSDTLGKRLWSSLRRGSVLLGPSHPHTFHKVAEAPPFQELACSLQSPKDLCEQADKADLGDRGDDRDTKCFQAGLCM